MFTVFSRGCHLVFFFPNKRNVGKKKSGQVMSGQVRPGQVRSVRSGQVVSGLVRSGQVHSSIVAEKTSNLWLKHMAYVC